MSKGKKEGRGTIKAVVYLLIVIILAGMVVYLTQSLRRERQPEITGTFIDSKLEAAGELTSAKMIYNRADSLFRWNNSASDTEGI